jgi:polar amino acid transport system ATP-binding protein
MPTTPGEHQPTTSTPVVIKVENLRKSYGDAEVLRGVDLEVKKGETIAVIGPSGTGKSTLLRCVNRLEEPTAGVIEVAGIRVEAGAAGRDHRRTIQQMRRHVGMVFQQYNLWPHLSVLRNVTEGPMRVLGRDKDACEERAREMLALVQMESFVDRYPGQLSGGQQQRVAIARALAMDPDAVLFDEVTSALDPQLVGEVLETMRRLSESGMTMMVVTHEMSFARRVADRVVFMDGGVIVEQGTPDAVLADPQNARTQQFLEHVRRSTWAT